MTAKKFLENEAERFGFMILDASDGDVDLKVDDREKTPRAKDLMQLAAILQEAKYKLYFAKDDSIHVHAPHREEHSWNNDGWGCTHGLTIEGCETFRTMEKYKGKTKEELLAAHAQAIQMRDACLGGLYRGINQGIIDEIDMVLRHR